MTDRIWRSWWKRRQVLVKTSKGWPWMSKVTHNSSKTRQAWDQKVNKKRERVRKIKKQKLTKIWTFSSKHKPSKSNVNAKRLNKIWPKKRTALPVNKPSCSWALTRSPTNWWRRTQWLGTWTSWSLRGYWGMTISSSAITGQTATSVGCVGGGIRLV